MFLTGSAGTGKTLMLSECLKIKLSKLKFRGIDVKIFVTTFGDEPELLDKYRQLYLVNIENIHFTNIRQMWNYLRIDKVFNKDYDQSKPQKTMKHIVRSLSSFRDCVVILLCDEIKCYESTDWRNMKTYPNVICLFAINPRIRTVGGAGVGGEGKMKIVPPISENVLFQQLQVQYRNCFQIRKLVIFYQGKFTCKLIWLQSCVF